MDTTTQATTATPASTPGTEAGTEAINADFTPAQLQQMAQWAVEDGHATEEEAAAMLAASGAPTAPTSDDMPAAPVELSGLPPIDLSDPAMQAEHASYMDVPPPGKPYEFDYSGVPEINNTFVSEMNSLCRQMELPGWLARYMGKAYVRAEAAHRAGQLTFANIELQHNKAEFTLRKMWGPEYGAKVAAAQSVLKSLPEPQRERVKQLFTDTGMGNDPLLISHFATLAQHRAARKGK